MNVSKNKQKPQAVLPSLNSTTILKYTLLRNEIILWYTVLSNYEDLRSFKTFYTVFVFWNNRVEVHIGCLYTDYKLLINSQGIFTRRKENIAMMQWWKPGFLQPYYVRPNSN